MTNRLKILALSVFSLFLLSCTPDIGSPEWCEMIKKKDKGDITGNEAKDFIQYCVLKRKNKD